MRKSKVIQVALLLLALGAFAAALRQPVWECSAGGKPFDGLSVLSIGFMGLLFFDPRWFSNIAFAAAVLSGALARPLLPPWLAFVVALVASSVFLGPFVCGVTGGPLEPGTALASGGKLWVVSFWLAALSVWAAPTAKASKAVTLSPAA